MAQIEEPARPHRPPSRHTDMPEGSALEGSETAAPEARAFKLGFGGTPGYQCFVTLLFEGPCRSPVRGLGHVHFDGPFALCAHALSAAAACPRPSI